MSEAISIPLIEDRIHNDENHNTVNITMKKKLT